MPNDKTLNIRRPAPATISPQEETLHATRRYSRPAKPAGVVVPPLPKLHQFGDRQFLEHADGRVQRLARKHTDLGKHEEFWAHLRGIREQAAKGEHDTTAHGVMADHIAEMVGNEEDPRALVVRHGVQSTDGTSVVGSDGKRRVAGGLYERGEDPDFGTQWREVTPEAYRVNAHSAMRLGSTHELDASGRTNDWAKTQPVVSWTVYSPRTKGGELGAGTHHFARLFDTHDELHDFIDRLPARNREEWRQAANAQGWHRTVSDEDATHLFGKKKLARPIDPRLLPTKPGMKRSAPKEMEYTDGLLPPGEAGRKPGSFGADLLRGKRVTRSMLAWGQQHAAKADISAFMSTHGYTDRRQAQQHVTALMVRALHDHREALRAGKVMGDGLLRVKHPDSGKTVTIRVTTPALPPVRKLARGKRAGSARTEHDALLHGAIKGHEVGEHTPMLVLADKLDEMGRAGGSLLRASHAAKTAGAPSHPQLAYTAWTGDDSLMGHDSKDGALTVRVHAGSANPSGTEFKPVLETVHWAEEDKANGDSDPNYLQHYIPVNSASHFKELIRDLEPELQAKLRRSLLSLNREHPMKLARGRSDDTGSAMASAGSKNHDARLQVVRQVLKESGLMPSTVRAALAHDGGKSEPAFAGVVKRAAHPDHLLYTAAWLGLLTGRKRLAVAHPDAEGEDFLHVVSAPGTPDQLATALRRGGIEKFTTEQTDGGARAFVLNPLGKLGVEQTVKGIPNARHSSTRVRVYRIGAGESSDANAGAESRRAYRSVIDGFERAADGTSDTPARPSA